MENNKNLMQAMEEYLDRISEIMVNELFENGSVSSGALAKSIQNDNDVVNPKMVILQVNYQCWIMVKQ